MPIPALNALLPFWGGRTHGTVAQRAGSCNALIMLGVITACVINGDTLSGVLEQTTQVITIVVVLMLVRLVASTQASQQLAIRHQPSTARIMARPRRT
ncbi:hypothetical protein [Streptomyces cucumeris]|uniref:hypothetical protein n=1 Tax=Streptomyces cucumeris TaxID=2962890 RepID=UPI003D75C085